MKTRMREWLTLSRSCTALCVCVGARARLRVCARAYERASPCGGMLPRRGPPRIATRTRTRAR